MANSIVEDGRLVFRSSPPTLQRLTMQAIIKKFLYEELIGSMKELDNGSFSTSLDLIDCRMLRLYQCLPNNKTIREKIYNRLRSMVSQLTAWSMHHVNVFPFSKKYRYATSNFLSKFVWNVDGEVDRLKTAKNFVRSSILTDEQKFQMACMYCMEDEIDAMYEKWDWVEDCLDMEEFEKDVFVYYWYCRCVGMTPRFPREKDIRKMDDENESDESESEDDEDESDDDEDDKPFEQVMLEGRPFEVPAMKYFFHQLDDEERMSFGTDAMMDMPMLWMHHLLPLFSEAEQRRIFEPNVVHMMEQMTWELKPEHCLQFWHFVKDKVRGKQYVEMLSKIFECDGLRDGDDCWMAAYTMDIWNDTPAHLKRFVYREQNNGFVLKWNSWYSFTESDGPRLRHDTMLLRILSDADVEYRERFWQKEWTKLVVGVRPTDLTTLLTICVPDTAARERAKKQIVEFDQMRDYLKGNIEEERFAVELNQTIDILISDPDEKIAYKKRLYPEFDRLPRAFRVGPRWTSDEQIDALGEFIDAVNDNNAQAALENKIKMINFTLTDFVRRDYFVRSEFNNVLYVAERLCGTQNMARLKGEMRIGFRMYYFLAHGGEEGSEYFKRMMTDAHRNYSWIKILLWAENGDRAKAKEMLKKWTIRSSENDGSYDDEEGYTSDENVDD